MRRLALFAAYWLVIVPWALLRRVARRSRPAAPASLWQRRPEPPPGPAGPLVPAPAGGRCYLLLLRTLLRLRARGAPDAERTRKLSPFLYDQY